MADDDDATSETDSGADAEPDAKDDDNDSAKGDKQPTDEERLIPEDEIAEDGQVYVDRDDLDFDPEEGLYSGTAVHGGTDIPGPHEQVDDVEPNESESDDADSDEADTDDSADDGEQD